MKRTTIALAFASLAAVVHGEIFSAKGKGAEAPADYVPALVSNGEISLCVDWTGMQTPEKTFNWWPNPSAAQVWWQGRRNPPPYASFLPYGGFTAKIKIDGVECGLPEEWEHSLDTRRAVTAYRNLYGGKLEVSGEIFVPKGRRAIVIRRKFAAKSAVKVDYAETYRMRGCERMAYVPGAKAIEVRTYGKKVCNARIGITAKGGEVTFRRGANLLGEAETKSSFALAAGETKTIDIVYSYSDGRFDPWKGPRNPPLYRERGEKEQAELAALGFERLLAEHEADWARYWAVGGVKTPVRELDRFADAAFYLLRCNVSRWGFPVGINSACWSGRYFGFDEMFQAQAMAATGRFGETLACAKWRKSILVNSQRRAGHYHSTDKYGAWLFWEMDEEGNCENCPPGFWEMHIFNHSTLSRTVWEHWNYTGDRKYLEETGYPVLLNMARYLRHFWVYDGPEGGKYIGKATDLERLGPARDRPFLTTCGVIDTFRLTAKAAAALGKADAETADFAAVAEKLVESLPKKDGAYSVCGEAAQNSVAQLGGLFPFPVLPVDDPAQAKAAGIILGDIRKYGNMYPMGEKTCPWYAGYISAAMSRLGNAEKAVEVLLDAAAMQGSMGTIWEINEPGLRKQPNFATAAGNCLYAITRLFVTEFEDRVEFFRGVPEGWKDWAFRLPLPGGAVADCEVKGGKLAKFALEGAEGKSVPALEFPASVAGGFDFGPGFKVTAEGGKVRAVR